MSEELKGESKQPTQEQIKEFWEWCGFKFWKPVEDGAYDILFPDESLCLGKMLEIDLNNLFKYAVPKLKSKTLFLYWIVNLIEDWAMGKDNDPALVLFWAMWEVMQGKIKEGIKDAVETGIMVS